MNGRINVLQLVRELPLPSRTGGHRRALGLASAWSTLGDVDVAGPMSRFGDFAELGPYRQVLPTSGDCLGRAAQVARAMVTGSPRLVSGSRRTPTPRLLTKVRASDYDVVVIEELLSAPLCGRLRDLFGVPIIYSAHNVEADIEYPYFNGHRAADVLRSLDRRALSILERQVAAAVDGIVSCTDDDAEALSLARRPVAVIPNCADPVVPPPHWTERRGVILLGSFGWLPNLEGLRWFVSEVLPLLPSRGELPVTVVSSALDTADQAGLEDLDVEVHIAVPDPVPFGHAARVAAVPVFTAGGSRVRIVEALELGLRVVTTTVGVQGQPAAVRSACEVCDDPHTFAAAIKAAHGTPTAPDPPLLPRWRSFNGVLEELWRQVAPSL